MQTVDPYDPQPQDEHTEKLRGAAPGRRGGACLGPRHADSHHTMLSRRRVDEAPVGARPRRAPGVSSTESRLRWVETQDARHATRGPAVAPGDEVEPLCDPIRRVTVIKTVPGRPAPECAGCDRRWREIEYVPQRDELVPALRRAASDRTG